jgi:hypothetical protein
VSPIAGTANRTTGVDDGTGRLSDFMLIGDPSKGGRRPAELTRRANDMGTLLCPPNGVDYMVSNVSWSPANPAPGQATTFSATITNLGNQTKAAGTINGVAFRVDGNLTCWSDNNMVALAPGQSITVTANSGPSGSATWSAASGAHTIEAWVDDVNRVPETDDNNNKLSAPLAVGVDLAVTNISWSPTFPSSGQPVTFSATFKNQGTVATQAGIIHGVRFEIDGQLVTWSDTSTASLAPGASRTVSANSGPSGSATWTAASGKHTLAAWSDDVNRLPDVDRSNNKYKPCSPCPEFRTARRPRSVATDRGYSNGRRRAPCTSPLAQIPSMERRSVAPPNWPWVKSGTPSMSSIVFINAACEPMPVWVRSPLCEVGAIWVFGVG